jgi:hypothetical protein
LVVTFSSFCFGSFFLIISNVCVSIVFNCQSVEVVLTPIASLKDVPTGIAVHGTYHNVWGIIKSDGTKVA